MYYALGLSLLLGSFLQSFNVPPWQAAHSEAFAFCAVLVWGCGAVRRNVQVRLNPPVIALIFVGLLISLQYASGAIIFGGDAAVLLLYVYLCILTILLAQSHWGDAVWPKALAFTLLVVSLVSAIIALTQALGVWADSDWIIRHTRFRRPGANLGQPNHLGTLLVMGAASLIYLEQRLGLSRSVAMLLCFILLMGMGITESRTGMLSGLALCLWWFARRSVFLQIVRWQWVAAGAVALITLMWLWPPLISYIQEGGIGTKETLNTAAGVRLEVWQQLWEAIWMKPWLGWGMRGVSVAHNAVLNTNTESAPFTYAHNIILDMAIGMGVPLTVAALCTMGAWGWRRMQGAKTIESWYAVGLLIPFSMHSLLEYPFAYAYFLIPAMLAIGMLEQHYAPFVGRAIPRKAFVGSLVVFCVLLTWMAIEYSEIEEDFRVARLEILRVGNTPDDYERPNALMLTQLGAMLEAVRIKSTPEMSVEQLALKRAVALRFPWAALQSSYALALALNDRPEEAKRQIIVIRAMHGDKAYQALMGHWRELSNTQYPQLKTLLPL
jgi:O-antigen ligase